MAKRPPSSRKFGRLLQHYQALCPSCSRNRARCKDGVRVRACAWHVRTPMLALPFNQGLCGGINSRVSKEVKLALDGADADAKPKVRAPRGAWPTPPPFPPPTCSFLYPALA